MNVDDMIVDLAGNKMADANNKFMGIMSDKINAALDAKKIELAKSFSSDEEVEIEDVENEEEIETSAEDQEETEETSDEDEEETETEDEEEVEDEDVQDTSDESS